MSECESSAEIVELLKIQKSMDRMDQSFEKEWLVIEKTVDLYLLCCMTSRILMDYDELSFEEIMLTLNYVFVGHSDGESAFSIKNKSNKNEKRLCINLLNIFVKIMEKLARRSSKIAMFEDYQSELDDDASFMMTILLIRIIGAIIVHLDTEKNDNLPILFDKEYVTLVKPLLQTLTDDFMILSLWLHDFISDQFGSRQDFSALVNNSATRNRSSDIPYHPCNGPFNDELKRKYEMVERNLVAEKSSYGKCNLCGCKLVFLWNLAIWPDCEHVCYCADCGRLMFIWKEGKNGKSRFLAKNKCPECSVPISIWSISRYFDEDVVNSPDPLPAANPVLDVQKQCNLFLEYETMHSLLVDSWSERRTVSYILPWILHATVLQLDMKYSVVFDSKMKLKNFKLHHSILSELHSGIRERGNLYLVLINVRCLQEAVRHFRKNLSWYSGPDTKDECLSVLDQIEKALGDLEEKYLTGTAISGA